MTNDRENSQQSQPQSESAEKTGSGRNKQFNELSELSLEERMAVADRIGLPVEDIDDDATTGAMTGRDDTAREPNGRTEEASTGEETAR